MNTSKKFSIRVCGQLIVVSLRGDWTEQDDLTYISLLSDTISEVRGSAWGILVDMRGWRVDEAATLATYKIALDRRNQKAEYWIVDDLEQGEFLLDHFKNTAVRPIRYLDPIEAEQAVKASGFAIAGIDITEQLERLKQ